MGTGNNDDNQGNVRCSDDEKNSWGGDGGVYIYKGGKVSRHDKEKIIHLIVVDEVTKIHCQAFERCKNLKTIQFGTRTSTTTTSTTTTTEPSPSSSCSLEEIDNRAFFECASLKSIFLPKSIRRIGKKAFHSCTNMKLTNPIIPSSLRIIEKDAFCLCDKLTDVHFINSSSIEYIGYHAFFHCRTLTNVIFSEEERENNNNVNKDNSTTRTKMKIQQLGRGTFAGCMSLETCLLPNSIKFLGRNVFFGCARLANIRLSNSLEQIGCKAFKLCASLESLTLPTSLKQLGSSVFEESGLKSISIPGSIQSLHPSTFCNCTDLVVVQLHPPMKVIGKSAFERCRSLNCLDMPHTVEKIDNYAFSDCSSLTTINFLSSSRMVAEKEEEGHERRDDMCRLKSIGKGTFAGCLELENIDIPSTIEEVGLCAFWICPKLVKTVNGTMIDTRSLHYLCDMNRAGKRYLQRYHHINNKNDNNYKNKMKPKSYPSGLWPMLLNRSLNTMPYPTNRIYDGEQMFDETRTDEIPIRRLTIVYYFMINGIAMDLH